MFVASIVHPSPVFKNFGPPSDICLGKCLCEAMFSVMLIAQLKRFLESVPCIWVVSASWMIKKGPTTKDQFPMVGESSKSKV